MKTIFIALGMAVVLFLYGYLFSMAGHDHDHHREGAAKEGLHSAADGGHHH